MLYNYTKTADPLARGKSPQHLTLWQPAQGTIDDLVQWAYVEGLAFAAGTFDHNAPLQDNEKTHKIARLWRGASLIVLDVDDAQGLTRADILADPAIQRHAGAVFPSSSYSSE